MKNNNFFLLSEICNRSNIILHENLQAGYVSKQDFLNFTNEDESKFVILIKKELKKILDIHNKRYSKEYGKITNTYISFYFEKPYLFNIVISGQNKKMFTFYVIQTSIEYNISKKKFIPDGYYIFYKSDYSGKNVKKIAEGNEIEEYTSKSKYGELLNIKFPKFKNKLKI